MKPLLVSIFVIAAGGLAFSGCAARGTRDDRVVRVAPACVYGFFTYPAILVPTAFALLPPEDGEVIVDRAISSAFSPLRAMRARTVFKFVPALSSTARGPLTRST